MVHNRAAWPAGNSWDVVLDDTDVGAIRWLLSDQATFVTGAVVPVDGCFSAFCGV